jgi:hypothetical protein
LAFFFCESEFEKFKWIFFTNLFATR